MLDPDLICYLVSSIAVCLGLLSVLLGPAIVKTAKRINELARDDDEEIQPTYGPLTIHGRACSRRSVAGGVGLKIPTDCPKTDYDFIVDLECPDGTVARIAIPIDPNRGEGKHSRV